MPRQKLPNPGFNRLRQKIPQALAQDLRQLVRGSSGRIAELKNRIALRVAYPFLWENRGA